MYFCLEEEIHYSIKCIFLEKAIETSFKIDTTPFLKCKQMLIYKLNLLSRIEMLCIS